MSLFEEWIKCAFTKEGQSIEAVWDAYLPKEQKIYEFILGEKQEVLEGMVSPLSNRFAMTPMEFIAFIDGLNDILPVPYDMKTLDENSSVRLDIDFAKLYKKMLEYKADHLVNLPQWKEIFSDEKRAELYWEQKKSRTVVKEKRPGRNDPCPCGSGKKYKKCCGQGV